jgi:hypothetical protein
MIIYARDLKGYIYIYTLWFKHVHDFKRVHLSKGTMILSNPYPMANVNSKDILMLMLEIEHLNCALNFLFIFFLYSM